MTNIKLQITVALLAMLMVGCAATVKKGGDAAPIRVGAEAAKAVVLNVTGSKVATDSTDWEPLKGLWRQAIKQEAAGIGASFTAQEGEPKSTGEAGTLLVVDVADFRYLSAGARYGFGVMTGNAYVKARVSFKDLKSGELWGQRDYDTSSTAWQGIFSAMTEKQIGAIAKEAVGELNHR